MRSPAPGRLAASIVLTGALVFLSADPASAHEEVKLGKVGFEIGFANEPVYTGFQNGVFLSIRDERGRAITDAAETLQVEVVYGNRRMEIALEPNFEAELGGGPGQYLANFIPTRPGKYTFHLSGSIGGQEIDRSFTSSPTTFDEAIDPTSVEFPAKDPAVGQVAERLDREVPRLSAAVAAARSSATDEVARARLIAIAGVGAGILGLVLGAVALVMARRLRSTAGRSPVSTGAAHGGT